MKLMYLLVCGGFICIAIIIVIFVLSFKPKLPSNIVILRWDLDKIIFWINETKEINDYLKPRADGTTMLHDMARYREYFSEKETDYEKFQKLILFYIENGGDPNLQNNQGETAYDIALKYDVRIADMIKSVMKTSKSGSYK